MEQISFLMPSDAMFIPVSASYIVLVLNANGKSAIAWGLVHLPFIMSYVLGGAALSRLVVARDCQDTSLEYLTEFYQEKSEEEMPSGLRWFYCAGFGIALFCMGTFPLSLSLSLPPQPHKNH
jgi:hypothetical protein